MAQDLLYLRDLAEVEPPRDKYRQYGEEDIYRYVPRPQWTGLDDEIWTPRNQESDPQLEKVKALMKKQSAEDVGLEANLSASRFASKLVRKHKKNPKVKIRKLIDHKVTEFFMFLFTMWALLMDDFRAAALDKEADFGIACVSLFVMIVFFVEVCLRAYVQKGYFGSFFFVLDLVATFTIIFDFSEAFSPPTTTSDAGGSDAAQQQLQMARVGRSARVGTRVGRLLRLLRVLRVLKLFMVTLALTLARAPTLALAPTLSLSLTLSLSSPSPSPSPTLSLAHPIPRPNPLRRLYPLPRLHPLHRSHPHPCSHRRPCPTAPFSPTSVPGGAEEEAGRPGRHNRGREGFPALRARQGAQLATLFRCRPAPAPARRTPTLHATRRAPHDTRCTTRRAPPLKLRCVALRRCSR